MSEPHFNAPSPMASTKGERRPCPACDLPCCEPGTCCYGVGCDDEHMAYDEAEQWISLHHREHSGEFEDCTESVCRRVLARASTKGEEK